MLKYKLKRVISGGQSGADITGLECARELSLETGGTVPKGCRTEAGNNYDLVKVYGCKESPDWQYAPRTRENVRNSNATLWFGNTGSPGYYCTRNAAKTYDKPFCENPSVIKMQEIANAFEVINIAGNRASTNPGVTDLVKQAFRALEPSTV